MTSGRKPESHVVFFLLAFYPISVKISYLVFWDFCEVMNDTKAWEKSNRRARSLLPVGKYGVKTVSLCFYNIQQCKFSRQYFYSHISCGVQMLTHQKVISPQVDLLL